MFLFVASSALLAQQTTGLIGPFEQVGTNVDLRSYMLQLGLTARSQGSRPTCSVFTMAGALEFAAARRSGSTPRLSVEFLNWASNKTCNNQAGGGFFSDLWRGFEKYGICEEQELPYTSRFDSDLSPYTNIVAAAKSRLELGLSLHWLKRWNVKTGLSNSEFSQIKQTLTEGWPVCAGLRWPKRERWLSGVLQMCSADAVFDGHSVLLVGFRDDAENPEVGVFLFRNTGNGGKDGAMRYAFARQYMNDAAWIK